MRAAENKGLTDNAWVKRIDYLRQLVSDNYNPADGSAQAFVTWYVDTADEEFDWEDQTVMLDYAKEMSKGI